VDTHVTVVRRAVKAEVDTERYRAPCWVLCAAVETYLQCTLAIVDRPSLNKVTHFVGGLCFQFREYVLRLRLRSKRHLDGPVGMLREWRIGGQVAMWVFGRRWIGNAFWPAVRSARA
jgi:hypothetical protein